MLARLGDIASRKRGVELVQNRPCGASIHAGIETDGALSIDIAEGRRRFNVTDESLRTTTVDARHETDCAKADSALAGRPRGVIRRRSSR
jgi:hypothetical protein